MRMDIRWSYIMRKQLTIIWDGRFSMKTIEKESSLTIILGCMQIISTVKGVINVTCLWEVYDN